MARILVTGYGGFLGREIVRQLCEAGFSVRGFARQRYADLEQLGLEIVQGDITNRAQVISAVSGCDAIVHTAAIAGVWGPWDKYYRINTAGTSHIVEAAVRHKVRGLVHTSSPSVTFAAVHQSGIDETSEYPQRWLCAYPHTKALAEQTVLDAARNGTVHACALRPHLIWGYGDPHLFPRVIQRTRAGALKRVGNGKNLVDVVHVRNAARAHLLALQRLCDGDARVNSQAFFVTDGQPVECWSWITRIIETAGLRVPTARISYRLAFQIGAVLESCYRLARVRSEPPMTRFVAAQLALDHYFSIDKARNLLGYAPEVDVDAEFQRCRPWLTQLANSRNQQIPT